MTASGSAPAIPVLGDDAFEQLTPEVTVESLEHALLEGLDIESDPPRLFSPLRAGEFLLMPSETATHAGIKVVTIAPGNGERGLPRIHAWYLLFDAGTLQPLAIVDGARLTLARTAAVTALAVRGLLKAATRGAGEGLRIPHLAVIGSGPQSEAHVRALAALMPIGGVSLLGRNNERVAARAAALADLPFPVQPADRSRLPGADVIVTVTSSQRPVLHRADVADHAVVAAIGSHGPANRELGDDIILDGDLVVESRASALRENGNLLRARPAEEWHMPALRPANLADLIVGRVNRRAGHPAVYTGVGMAWEDLVVVARLVENERRSRP